jgi:hypothetical protein
MAQRPVQVERPLGIREWLNRHPGVTIGIVAGIALLAIVAIVVQVLASRKKYPDALPQAYFTVDDGKTYFSAGMENVPPFQHDGQTAIRAYVFQCGTGEPFVGYVERYTPAAHKAMVENRATPQHQIAGRELKKPGEAKWVKSTDRKAAGAIADVRCPDGSQPEPLEQ